MEHHGIRFRVILSDGTVFPLGARRCRDVLVHRFNEVSVRPVSSSLVRSSPVQSGQVSVAGPCVVCAGAGDSTRAKQ